jgi:hypothetical protein
LKSEGEAKAILDEQYVTLVVGFGKPMVFPTPKLKAATLRLPEEIDKKLQLAVKKGKAAAKIELVRRAIDEFVENHPDMFT